jgi:H+/Cl- antiporter ClcA
MGAFFLACILGLISGALITAAAFRKLRAGYPTWGWLLAIIIFLVSAFIIFFISGVLLDKFGGFER